MPAPHPKKASRADRAVTNLAVAAAAFAVLFAAAELTSRAAYDPENLVTIIRFDPNLGWSLKPETACRSVDYQLDLDYVIKINSLGMREREIARDKPRYKRRILMIGDSVTFGTGVDADWRFSNFMQRALGEDIEVINAGVPGWGTDQEWIHYEMFAHVLEPDIVVLTFTMANDVVNNGLDHLFLGSAPKPRFTLDADSLYTTGRVVIPADAGRPFWKTALRRSRFLLFVKRRIDRRTYASRARRSSGAHEAGGAVDPARALPTGFRNESSGAVTHWSVFEVPPSRKIEEAWRVTEAILVRFARRCEGENTRLIVFALPPRVEVDVSWRSEIMRRAGLDPAGFDFARPFERLSDFCRLNGIEFLHPSEVFSAALEERELYHSNDPHPDRFGHALAARCLLERLRKTYGVEYEIAESDRRFTGTQ